ncbi:MAG: hypothetical protein PUB11_04020 [Oscillospiraceae bacterium]|nr:hypothetical protein [Oscillospiraceae bacterium]
MNHLKKLFTLTLLIFLCGCVEGNDIPDYNLNLISPSLFYVYDHYKQYESETDKYINCESSDYSQYINEQTIKDIHSVTVCDDKIEEGDLSAIIKVCKDNNIPLFFVMNNIAENALSEYDKAYCISADYNYIGEKFGDKIYEIWTDSLKDRDNNQILTYAAILPESLSDNQSRFYRSMTERMKLLGIPLDLTEEIYLSKGDVLSYCVENQKKNECFFVLDSAYLSLFGEYEFYSDGVEVIGMDFSAENRYSDNSNMLVCNIDCKEYFDARDEILSNLDEQSYPFKNLDYTIIEKTIYIEPEF